MNEVNGANPVERLVMLSCPFCGKAASIQTKNGSLGYEPDRLFIKCCHAYIDVTLDDIKPIFHAEDRDRLGRHNQKVEEAAMKKLVAAWNVRAT